MNFEELKEKRNISSEFGKYLGMYCEELKLGEAVVSLKVNDNMHNRINSVHGGVLFSLCDQACGTACATHFNNHVTLDASIHYLRPAINSKVLIAKAKEIKYGHNIAVYKVFVYDDANTEICYGTFSYSIIEKDI